MKISYEDEDIPFIKTVAYRDGYSVEFKSVFNENDEHLADYAEIDADASVKEEFLEDVECEKQSAAYGGLPVYSLRTISNPEKLGRLTRLNKTDAFIILKKDEEAYLKM